MSRGNNERQDLIRGFQDRPFDAGGQGESDEGEGALRRLLEEDTLDRLDALTARDGMSRFTADELAPGPDVLDGLSREEPGLFRPFREGVEVRLDWVELPERQGFGQVGEAVELGGESVVPGVLAVPFDGEALGAVARETLRLFRWEEQRSSYQRVALSRVVADRDVVWGVVSTPGVYALIGLNADPRVLRTILTLQANDATLRALPERGQREFLDRVCGLILCAPDMQGLGGGGLEAMLADQLANGWPAPSPGYGGELGGSPCELCLGLRTPWAGLPDFQTLPGGRPAGGGGGFFDLPGRLCTSRWESVGPTNIAGCMLDVCPSPSDPKVVYAAAANGGLWRLDANASFTSYAWRPLTDDLDLLSVVAVTVSPSAPSVVFLADTQQRIRRSINSGVAWSEFASGLGVIRRLVAHPTDPDQVYVASSSGLWLAGRTSPPVQLHQGDVTDMALDPGDPAIIYIGVRNTGARRRDSTGNWSTILSLGQAAQLSVGTYAGVMVKIAVGSQGTTTTRRVAVKLGPRSLNGAGNPASEGYSEVFVNQGSGTGAWTRCTTPPALGYSNQGDWVNVLAVDPGNDNTILVGSERLARSADGGQTWSTVMSYYSERGGTSDHEDQHAVAFLPGQPGVCYVANDGGIYRSTDSGAHFQGLNKELVTTQPFNFGIESNLALMDTYHWGVLGSRDINGKQFEQVEGGSWEFVPVRGDPQRSGRFYYLRGAVTRRLFPPTGVNDYAAYTPWPISWGLAFDPRPGSMLAFAGRWLANVPASEIWRTTVADQQSPAWTQDTITGGVLASPIIAIHFAASNPETAYAVTQDGDVVQTTGSSSATAWTHRGTLPFQVRSVSVNRFDPNRLYAASQSKVSRSVDGGQTWQDGTGTGSNVLPVTDIYSIVTSPHTAGDLFLGTDIGVFYSPDEGFHWYPIHDGLPNAPAWEITWSGDSLYAAVHGRGLWRTKPYA